MSAATRIAAYRTERTDCIRNAKQCIAHARMWREDSVRFLAMARRWMQAASGWRECEKLVQS